MIYSLKDSDINNYDDKCDIYKNIAEINYMDLDLNNDSIYIEFSRKFIKKYDIPYTQLTLSSLEFFDLIYPDYRGVFNNLLNKVENSRLLEEQRVEFRCKFPKTDRYCWISIVVEKHENQKCYGVLVDISESKQKQTILNNAKEEYETIISNTNDLIAKYNIEGRITFASTSFCEMFNIDCDDVKGNDEYIDKYMVKTTDDWFTRVIKPPYKTKEVVSVKHNGELRWISWSNNVVFVNGKIDHIVSIGHDITELHNANTKLEYENHHDTTTGLLNRLGLRKKVKELESVKNIASFLVKVNNFKEIHNLYGHSFADKLIFKITEVLSKYSNFGCFIGRLNESELVVLLPNYNNSIEIDLMKSQIIDNLSGNYQIDDKVVYASTSIGYALYPEDTEHFDTLIYYSDLAMYESKLKNDNGCHRFDKSMLDRVNNNVKLSKELKHALDNDGINLVYQSIIDTDDNTVRFIETLARWEHDVIGSIPPSVFFPLAEDYGLVEQLDFYIIEHALEEFTKITNFEKYQDTILTLNVSMYTLLSNIFPTFVKNLLDSKGIDANRICIEISENTFMQRMDECVSQILNLRDIGVIVALDDFGSKYSSLAVLDRVDFDIIKVDRTFINTIADYTTTSILRMIHEISEYSDKKVIIEGVETIEQVVALNDIGFNLIQGYFYSVPGYIFYE